MIPQSSLSLLQYIVINPLGWKFSALLMIYLKIKKEIYFQPCPVVTPEFGVTPPPLHARNPPKNGGRRGRLLRYGLTAILFMTTPQIRLRRGPKVGGGGGYSEHGCSNNKRSWARVRGGRRGGRSKRIVGAKRRISFSARSAGFLLGYKH